MSIHIINVISLNMNCVFVGTHICIHVLVICVLVFMCNKVLLKKIYVIFIIPNI